MPSDKITVRVLHFSLTDKNLALLAGFATIFHCLLVFWQGHTFAPPRDVETAVWEVTITHSCRTTKSRHYLSSTCHG